MHRISGNLALALLLLTVTACMFTAPAAAQRLEPVADGLSQPVAIALDDAGRLYFVEQAGTVRIYADGKLADTPFLDIRDRVGAGGERGLLGLALAGADRAFAYYTDTDGTSVLARFRVANGFADAESETVLMTVAQPFPNHNGGELRFGPDGYLYWALGDGGSGGDPQGHGQNLSTLLGTILRLDVSGDGVAIPSDNPFVGKAEARPEIWVYGLRNPWRFSFDRENGDLYIGDVGQNQTEEIDYLPAQAAAGVNFGWNIMEGDHCFRPSEGCDETGLVSPIVAYPHAADWGNSVTGGYVYRGSALPQLTGKYLFADFGSGRVWTATHTGDAWTVAQLLETGFNVATFGEDADGELYLVDYRAGIVYRLVP